MFKLGAFLGLVAGYILARALYAMFPSFPAGGMALVTATSAALGGIWHAKLISRRLGFPSNPIVLSRPVACLSLWFFGIVYGGLLASILGSYALAGIAICLSVLAVAIWHNYRSLRLTFSYYFYVTVAMLCGMASLLLFVRYATASF